MKTPLIALCALCAVLAACSSRSANKMKPGLWETHILKMTANGQDMLPAMKAAQEQMRQRMASLPPEQRKQMEASMGVDGDPTVQRMCVSAEMAENAGQAMLPKQANVPGCAEPKVSRSGNRVTFETSCKTNGGTVATKGESVIDGDQITAKAEVVTTMAGATHTMESETEMKFIDSDCGDLKPMDQLSRRAGK